MLAQALEELEDGTMTMRNVPSGQLLRRIVRDKLHEAAPPVLCGRLQNPFLQAEQVHRLWRKRCAGLRVVPTLPLAMLLHIVHDPTQLPQGDAPQLWSRDCATGAIPQLAEVDASVGKVVRCAFHFGARRWQSTGAAPIILRKGFHEEALRGVHECMSVIADHRGEQDDVLRLPSLPRRLDQGRLRQCRLQRQSLLRRWRCRRRAARRRLWSLILGPQRPGHLLGRCRWLVLPRRCLVDELDRRWRLDHLWLRYWFRLGRLALRFSPRLGNRLHHRLRERRLHRRCRGVRRLRNDG
mmetsp:Transcript_54611/g.158032  ORF Transcript_54611/g.158032 Transcript_54611/m.158032 type:complete len:296 (-) Transcript_54611:1056-1943(-)